MNRLQELKVKASLLRKKLKSSDKLQQEKAAERFLILPFHKYSKIEDVLVDIDFYQLKHAYWVLALEKNHDTWQQYRYTIIKEDCMYTDYAGSFLNVWYANYNDAKKHKSENGGYLLQYRKDYFICSEDMIKELQLAHLQKEWNSIGYDWVHPKNKTAWNIIFKEAKKNYLERCKQSSQFKPVDKSNKPEWLSK